MGPEAAASGGSADLLTSETFLAAVSAIHLDQARALEVLALMGAHHQAALTLRYLEGLSVPDVADRLGRTVHATEALLVRARAAFRRAYGERSMHDFYRAAFAAVETLRFDMPDGRIGHAELDIGGASIALADEYPEAGIVGPASLGGTSVSLQLLVPDVDAVVARAVAAGATVEREVTDQFHGNRSGTIIDPFGHRWMVQTKLEDVSIEEMHRRLEEETDESQ